MPAAGADALHCQHVVGDATERVGRDLGDVGMINNFPAKDDTEGRFNEGVRRRNVVFMRESSTESVCIDSFRRKSRGRHGDVRLCSTRLQTCLMELKRVHTHTHTPVICGGDEVNRSEKGSEGRERLS